MRAPPRVLRTAAYAPLQERALERARRAGANVRSARISRVTREKDPKSLDRDALGIPAQSDPRAPPRDLDVTRFDGVDGEMIVLAFPIDDLAANATLTPAEHAIVTALESGKSNAEIARERGTSARTVANQIASVFRKLKVGSRAELVATRAVLRDAARADGSREP
jgi:DNA-binding NarL/FixJ family response regulator